MAAETASLFLWRIAGAHAYFWLMRNHTVLPGHVSDSGERRAQVAFHVDSKCFERANVNNAAALCVYVAALKHQPVEAPEEGCQRLASSRRSENQGAFALRNGGPAKALW